jgi:type II secretory pathway pseudopilin PulG
MKQTRLTQRLGFAVIELVVAVAIVGLVASAFMSQLNNPGGSQEMAQATVRETARTTFGNLVQTAAVRNDMTTQQVMADATLMNNIQRVLNQRFQKQGASFSQQRYNFACVVNTGCTLQMLRNGHVEETAEVNMTAHEDVTHID